MTCLELSSALRCDPSPLRRLMRVLVHLQIFKEKTQIQHFRQYMERVSYAAANPDHSKLINEGMVCNARVVVPAVIESCLEVFKGIETIASALRCDPSPLYRIMRVLVHLKIFKEETAIQLGSKSYVQTPLSKRLLTSGEKSMAVLILLESSPVMLAPWHGLSARIQGNIRNPVFEEVHGEDLWSFGAANPDHNKLFNEAMACDARVVVPAVIESCIEVFKGLDTIVDVGAGNGTALCLLVEACPWIQGINFDLPHVVSVAQEYDRIENVGGDMFDYVPKADAVIIKWVLHDWEDDECIRILKNCREAIPEDKGKVIIIEAVIDENDEKEDSTLTNVRLMLDMVMMAHTNTGKERTLKEWGYVLGEAGFSRHTITPIHAVQYVIQAFP